MLPIMLENMALLSQDDELSIAFYGPMTATADIGGGNLATLTQDTNYPFDENVQISVQVSTAVSFPLRFRIPGWCQSAQISVNGVPVGGGWQAGTWATIERQWQTGDNINIVFPMNIEVSFQDVNTDVRFWIPDAQKEGTWAEAVVIERGPLLYSLPVLPAVHNPLQTMGQYRGAFEEIASANGAWNYALEIDSNDPASSFQVKTLTVPPGTDAWQLSPIALEVDARIVPGWTCTEGDLIGQEDSPRLPDRKWVAPDLPEIGFAVSPTTDKIQLVPYGFTTLRMTYLPWIESQN